MTSEFGRKVFVMKFVRFLHDGKEFAGILENGMIRQIKGEFWEEFQLEDKCHEIGSVKLLAPCKPSKVIAVGLNYKDHISEFGNRDIPDEPVLFIKLPHAVIGPGESIRIPEGATRVDYEAELAVVIGKHCFNVSEAEASQYILGATCLNDVTERHIQRKDGQWTRAKNFPTFCPIGPCIATGIDYSDLAIRTRLNGQITQDSRTSYLIWNAERLVSFISKVIPLFPGDVVTTGTPSGVGPMKPGDIVEVEIEGIGTLRNPVI